REQNQSDGKESKDYGDLHRGSWIGDSAAVGPQASLRVSWRLRVLAVNAAYTACTAKTRRREESAIPAWKGQPPRPVLRESWSAARPSCGMDSGPEKRCVR